MRKYDDLSCPNGCNALTRTCTVPPRCGLCWAELKPPAESAPDHGKRERREARKARRGSR